jgi:hypothetical protein
MINAEEALEKVIGQLDSMLETRKGPSPTREARIRDLQKSFQASLRK